MTTVVMNSAGEVERMQTGNTPERPELAADNAKAIAKAAETQNGKQVPDSKGDRAGNGKDNSGHKSADGAATVRKEDAGDDIEGEDGLTPREKREYTEKMLKTVARKTRQIKDAEEFAAAQYNERTLADRRAQAAEDELAKLRQPAAKPVEATKPERANFDSDAAYQDALVDFRVKETIAKERREQAEQAEQQRHAEVIRVAHERLKAAAALVPDFKEVTEEADIRVPGHIAGYMQESEMFAELGYHFAKHPEVLERLQKLNPARALVEVGKIESTLQPFAPSGEKASKTESANGAGPSPTKTDAGQSTSGPSKQSRAPVIKPLGSDSVSQVDKDPREMTTREHIEHWKKTNKANIGLRKRH